MKEDGRGNVGKSKPLPVETPAAAGIEIIMHTTDAFPYDRAGPSAKDSARFLHNAGASPKASFLARKDYIMVQIMTANQHTSAAFTVPSRVGSELTRYTSLLGQGHPGSGVWELEVQTPPDEDGNEHWVLLGGSGGVRFEEDGELFFYCARGRTYRVRRTSGSAVGLRLWLADTWQIVSPGVS